MAVVVLVLINQSIHILAEFVGGPGDLLCLVVYHALLPDVHVLMRTPRAVRTFGVLGETLLPPTAAAPRTLQGVCLRRGDGGAFRPAYQILLLGSLWDDVAPRAGGPSMPAL